MAELLFYSGTMDAGKSTLALQTHHNHSVRHRAGLVFTTNDRSGKPFVTSRLGMSAPATNIEPETNIYFTVQEILDSGHRVDYLVCDEAQFYTREQIDQLADIVDGLGIDVYAFGITTDFRTLLFPAAGRLIELADRVITTPVPALCWCGQTATHQARLVDGTMVMEGAQVAVGDMNSENLTEQPTVTYEVLCRKHHRQRLTASTAKAQVSNPSTGYRS